MSAGPAAAPHVELQGVTKRFGGAAALDDVSLVIPPGERLAIVGENGAGKSSLMNVLYGLYRPDAGRVLLDGAEVRLKTPADALARGLGMVHQHFTLVPTLSVAENVVLGAEPVRGGLLLDTARAIREVEATCRRFGFQLDVRATVGSLTVGSQQKVEIVKALHRGARLLVLDEPSAVLTPQETDELFKVVGEVSAQGVTVVLVSHKLPEVLAFAQRVVVLRRGKKVAEWRPDEPVATTPAEHLASLMVGEAAAGAVTLDVPREAAAPPLLSLEDVRAGVLGPVSLTVGPGEIVGVAGVDGNGQRELAEVVCGLRALEQGALRFEGAAVSAWTPGRARAVGVAHIPEDRLARAVAVALRADENVSLGRQRAAPFAKGPRIDFAGRQAHTLALLQAHDVRPPDPAARLGGLSGGNQQKLVVARELDAAPKLLVAVQPTRGLDIAAVAAVRRHLLAARARGCAVLLISLDLEEVLALSDRLYTLFAGRVSLTLPRAQFDERAVGRAMLGAA